MAAFNLVANMYDPALKPRLIHKLLREHVPDDKRAFNDHSELSKVVSMIKIHNLLSESLHSMDQKLIDSWKSAVDSWVNRLFLLLSNDMPDKCWAGIILLGVTCQQCSSSRFLASYTEWLHRLLPHVQTDSQFLKVASCASISDLFLRLGRFQSVKKDGTSCAGKVIQPVIKLLHDDNTEAVLDAAVNLLCTLIAFFPFTIHRHYDSAEAAIVSKIYSGKCGSNMLKKLAHCLASLPKSKGDEDSWSLLMQKILLSIDSHLNEAFQGIGEDSKGHEVLRLLIPPGKNPPPPLGCNSLSEDSFDKITRSSERMLTPSISTLMFCCSTMITSSYNHQVAVPIRPLLAIVKRVLTVDGSLPPTSVPFMTSLQQESMCSELPALHSDSLDLLIAIVKRLRSQLLPHAASIVRLIVKYFKKCVSAELRVKVYAVAKLLMMSLGVGMAASLARDVIDNALVDLNPVDNESCDPSSVNPKEAQRELLQHYKKRKRPSVPTSMKGQHERHGSGDITSSCMSTSVHLRIAALEALETLLTLAGALRTEEGWRAKVEHLLITAATSSFEWPQASDDIFFRANEFIEVWADYQLAAFRALLASFLSSVHVRPLALAQGLELFRKGKQENGSKLAEFCAHALLAMEVLIHPRVLPLSDFLPVRLSSPEPQATYKFQEDMYFGSMTSSKLLKIDTQGMEQSDPELDDEFSYDRVFANNIEEAPIRDATGNPINDYEMTYNISNDLEKEPYANGLVSIETPKTTEQAATAAVTEVGVVEKVDVFASPMSSKSDKTDDFVHDLGSKLLQEDDFPDIIDADPDTDYEG
ncbi:proline-, glutamic acid- and leucine-rich protein 1-like isoform X1 [Cucurbita moschata]|uniref:Proline-, glutamic acid- and leucine-rich protein 1-like isoform X1 n=1 Tax=Cucurbita moschata TaxID=3662 RepID=A0A6J1GYU8_CUCMO|nr:proline-, glutamic acid- and leucine-rich protein 1-like isoform X1 [Cucurbita moschata]XP_022956973.1 proline-, glutamic acid- and leucine-rich protein 1-like isoform X1 [Cucurbita moschata]XP_022956974.1 proline-, glutamic acid- and leucine-rich protein 1-like isoform X1 [Cucurbita moschata]XP_022956975.1 proline-, glutamic acid- and leucine-rich protein 1-like isoform X1 [Cucurbita moschata]